MANYLGIDITHDSLRIAQVHTGYRSLTVALAQEFPLQGPESLSETLHNHIRPLCTKSYDICISFPGDASFVRTIELPSTASKQLSHLLPFELEAQLPFDMDEMVYAFKRLAENDSSKELRVLAVAAPVDKVASLLEQVRAGLDHEPERVEPSTFALANLAAHADDLTTDQPIGILHVDTATTDFLLLHDGQVKTGRTVRSGTAGLPASGAKLARELKQTVMAWRASGGAPLSTLYVTGPGANLQGVLEFFAGHLQVPTHLLPLLNIEGPLAGSPEQLHRFSRATALALGLGSRPRSFNLRAGPLAYERGYGFLKDKIPLMSALAITALLSFAFSTWMNVRALDRETEVLRSSLGDVTLDVLGKRIEDPDEALSKVSVSRSKLADPMPKLDAFDVMVAISEVVPEKTTHDIEELDYQKGHVTIHGIVPTIPDAQAIATALKKRPCFKNVKIVRTNKVVNQDRQKYVLEFEIMCKPKSKKKKKKSSTPEEN